ncbi:MAG: GMP reductase, partial [Proteobacteria bacterium]|nr:GMP reductase [Pseudomonadota bacterium]NBP13740.1 GMP reductase [bacterium]
GAHIIADGGCTCPGDIAKAFGAGADFVMLGGMFAGHDEGGGKPIYKSYLTNELDNKTGEPYVDTQDFVEFYGMSSDTAMSKHHGGVAEYRSSEGRTVEIPYRGSVNETVLNILGGLRSTCTYVGAETLKQLPKCTTFIRVNRQINDVFVK